MDRSEHALEEFASGLNCSQAVLTVYAEELGLDPALAKRVACGFGRGIAGREGICGAVTGAVMVIGLKVCTPGANDWVARVRTNMMVQTFLHEFEARNEYLTCRELLEDGYSAEAGSEETSLETFGPRCPDLVRDAVEILEELF